MKLALAFSLLLSLFAFNAHAHFRIVVASYNVENFFDNIHDPNKDDDDFTWRGKEHWTEEKMLLKADQLAKMIHAMNGGRGPDIITLPEVENIRVLTILAKKLKDLRYTPVLVEGPDRRGIDVGLLTRFPLARQIHTYRVDIPGTGHTRPVYDVALQLTPKIKFGILMNHWPSRRAPPVFRCAAGKTLKAAFQLHLARDPDVDYIATGDFNDEPEDPSFTDCLKTGSLQETIRSIPSRPVFYNLYSERNLSREARGTYWYGKRKEWDAIDNIVVAKGLFDSKNIRYVPGSFRNVRIYGLNVFNKVVKNEDGFDVPAGAPVSFTTTGKPGDLKAYGVSDHLPVEAAFDVIEE